MTRYAMIDDAAGIVVNVIEWDGNEANWRSPTGYTMVEDTGNTAGPGFKYDGTNFTPPPSGDVGTAGTTSAPVASEIEVKAVKVTKGKK